MLRLLWIVFLALTVIHIGYVVAHEPFAYDAWNMARDTHAVPFSLGNFLEYGVGQYTHSNPRIGQWFTYLAYKLELFAPIATPLVYLALGWAVTTLGLGRFPSWRRSRDLAFVTIALGCAWLVIPNIGMLMFCRAYSANYVYGTAIQLWFLVPLRLRPRGNGSFAECAAYLLFGIIAGTCNEHTGPTLALVVALNAFALHRRETERPNLALAGALGFIVGFALIFLAPGQGERYDGLATKVGFVGRLLQRGFTGNLAITSDFLFALAPILALSAIALAVGTDNEERRVAIRRFAWTLAAGMLITATVFVSPKLGPRFFMHACALSLAAFIGIADATLTTPRRLAGFVAFAVIASGYAAARTIPLYARLDENSHDRLAALEKSTPGTSLTVDAFDQVEFSWWFLGDDFRDPVKREFIATYFGLTDVVFRAQDVETPLGVTDVRIVPKATLSPTDCLEGNGGFELERVRGFDVAYLQREVVQAIRRMETKLAPAHSLVQADLVVDFMGTRPALPRPTLLLGRWQHEVLESWVGTIERVGSSRTRRLVLPKTPGPDFPTKLFIYSVGHDWKELGPDLNYEPWRRGTYWALACGDAECFVIAATRML